MVTFINLRTVVFIPTLPSGRCHRDTGRRTPSRALSSTQKWTVHGDPRADTAAGEGAPRKRAVGLGNRGDCSAMGPLASGFMATGLVSRSSLDSHLPCALFGPIQAPPGGASSLSQDGFQREGFWEAGRTHFELASPPSFWPLPDSPG